MRIEKEWEKMRRRARVERVKNGKKGAMSKKRSNLSDTISSRASNTLRCCAPCHVST